MIAEGTQYIETMTSDLMASYSFLKRCQYGSLEVSKQRKNPFMLKAFLLVVLVVDDDDGDHMTGVLL